MYMYHFVSVYQERVKREGMSYSAYAGRTSFQPSSNSDKVLIWNALLRYVRSVIHAETFRVYNGPPLPEKCIPNLDIGLATYSGTSNLVTFF